MSISEIIRRQRRTYLACMFSPFAAYFLVTVSYFVFGGDLKSWQDLAGTTMFLLFWNGVVTVGGATLLYRGLSRADHAGGSGLPSCLGLLLKRSRLLVLTVGLLYVGFISWLGWLAQPESYFRPNEIIDFTLSIVYSYVVIPVYFLSILLDGWSLNLRTRLATEAGVVFPPGQSHLRGELLAAFLVLALLPLASIYVNLWSLGLFADILSKDPYMASYGLTVLVGLVVLVLTKTRVLTRPLSQLTSVVEAIRAGDYHGRAPVAVDNELGQLADKVNAMAAGLEERERMREVFGKAVDPAVRDRLMAGAGGLGGELRDLTLLFSDLRGFTSLAEGRDPSEVLAILNRYFDAMDMPIRAQGGVVNKYIGDAVLAVFGLEGGGDHTLRAARAAVGMQRALRVLNAELAADGLPVLQAGIGLHRAQVVAGTVGSAERHEFTVIGDGVNLAARIEGLTKDLSDGPALSRAAVEALGAAGQAELCLRPLDELPVKGRQHTVELWELLDGLEDADRDAASAQLPRWLEARGLVRSGRPEEARPLLESLLTERPADKIYRRWLEALGPSES